MHTALVFVLTRIISAANGRNLTQISLYKKQIKTNKQAKPSLARMNRVFRRQRKNYRKIKHLGQELCT